MEFKRDRSSNIPFGLHDSRIKQVVFRENILTLVMDKLFRYTEYGEETYPGSVDFNDCDLDECSVFIFDRTVYEGEFSGEAVGLKEYIEKHSHLTFEILTEGYSGYCTTYIGWIWEEGKEPVSGLMNIWNTGDIVYRICAADPIEHLSEAKFPPGATQDDVMRCKKIVAQYTEEEDADKLALYLLNLAYAKGGDYSERSLEVFAKSYFEISETEKTDRAECLRSVEKQKYEDKTHKN